MFAAETRARRRRGNEGAAQRSFLITADAGPRRNSSACQSSIAAVSLRRAVTREEEEKKKKSQRKRTSRQKGRRFVLSWLHDCHSHLERLLLALHGNSVVGSGSSQVTHTHRTTTHTSTWRLPETLSLKRADRIPTAAVINDNQVPQTKLCRSELKL